ncbi:MAG: FUSC family protein [Candidatus Cybelea sp.]
MLTWLRELAATVGTFDRSSFEPGYALRCTVGVAIPLVIAAALGHPAAGVPAAIGAFITGFTSLQGIYRTRLAAILLAALGMSAASFVGAIAAHSTPALVAATALVAYAFATIGQIGPAASTVALNSLVAFVLFSSQPLPAATAAEQSLLVFAGGLIQAALLLIAWPTARGTVERTALADVYSTLATYARGIADGSAALPPITPLATARQVLADPQPFARAADLARFNRLLEDSEIVRRRLGALTAMTAHGAGRPASAALLRTVADRLSEVADVLTGSSAVERTIDLRADDALELAAASDLAAHLRDATEAASMLARGRLPRFALLSQPRPGPYVQNHIDWLSRDSLRFALVLAIAMILGRHFAAHRGYWIPLTAALVLKPDFQTTFVRGAARIAGTLLGAVVATAALALLHGRPALEIAGLLLAAAAAYLSFNPNYALFTVAITSFVVIVLAMRGLPGTTTIDERLLDTLAGGALAMVGYLVLPTWERKRTRALLADFLNAQRGLADAILQAYAVPSVDARKRIDDARSELWKVRTAVETSIDRTRNEPRGHHTIGAARALRILAATQRFALASFALETALETEGSVHIAGLGRFNAALVAEMTELSQALRDSRRARPDETLSAATTALETELGDAADAQKRFVVARLRSYAEACVRIARLIGTEKTSTA